METNPTLEYGYEHRIGAKLHDYEYNDTIDKEDLVPNIRACIDSLYTTSLDKQRAACGIRRVGGMMSDFKHDTTGSAYYGFSSMSYVLKFPLKNVFFFNSTFVNRINRHSGGYPRKINGQTVVNPISARHKKFFSISDTQMTPTGTGTKSPVVVHKKGGTPPPTQDNYHITFNITDTANRPDVFSHRLLFFVDGKLFTGLMLYVVSNYVIMVIDAEKLEMSLAQVDTYTNPLYDYRWTLIGIPYGNFYKTPAEGANVSYTEGRINLCTWEDRRTYELIDGKKVYKENYPGDSVNCTAATGFNIMNQYNEPSGTYMTAYAYEMEYTKVSGRSVRQKTGLMTLCFDPVIKAVTTETFDNGDGTFTDHSIRGYGVNCFDSARTGGSLGMVARNKFDNSTSKDIHVMEFKNIAAVIPLKTNRIFQVGCDDNIPGPVPPENILIFKIDPADGGLRLVHMVSSEYKTDQNTYNNEYDKLKRIEQKPLPASIAFKRKNGDIYDDPKFIPTRDEYNPGEDVHGTYTVNKYTDRVDRGYVYTDGEAVSERIDIERAPQRFIDLHYPNVYHLVNFDSADDLIAVVLYDKSCNNAFSNPLSDYITYNANYANDIVAGNIPKVIKDYVPEINRYSEDNYLNAYHTKATRATEHQFKLEALREMVNDDSRRLNDIYDRRYKKVNNNMHANVKYLIDLTKDSTDPDIDKSTQKIKHLYRDQLTKVYATIEYREAIYVRIQGAGGTYEDRPIDGITLYYDDANNLLLDMWENDANGVPFDANYSDRFVRVIYHDQNNIVRVPFERITSTRAYTYNLYLNHKENLQFPVSIWVDGIRLQNTQFNTSSSAFRSKISILSSAIGQNAKMISIEMYKMRNTNSMYKILTLPDIHNSLALKVHPDEPLWDDISPQNMMVAIEKRGTISDGDNNEVDITTRYLIPSEYEMYWLLFGNVQYVNGVPVNVQRDEAQLIHNYMYRVIKSMQAKYTDSSGTTHTDKEAVLLADDNVALIGETDETFMGNVSLLKTFGDKEYYKVFSDEQELYQYFIAHADEYQIICQKVRNNGLTDAQKSEYDLIIAIPVADRTQEQIDELAEYEAIMTDYLANGLSSYDQNVYNIYREIENSIDVSETEHREYVLMLREGFYSRDRKRFYDYMPMGSKDPMVYITPITSFFANKTVMVKNTDVFITKSFAVQPTVLVDKQRTFVYPEFGLDPSPLKFRVFLEGKLLDYDYDYIMDINLDNQDFYTDSDLVFYIRKNIDVTRPHLITLEYLPYKYGLVYRGREYDGIVMLADEYIRPFDVRHYDVYLDGVLLNEDQIDIVTERRISIKPVVNAIGTENEFHPIVSIYERLHDADVFDFVWRNHKTAFSYIDHTDPVVTRIDPRTGQAYQDDNVKRQPPGPEDTIDVKMAQLIKHSLDEQLIRSDPAYRKYRTPTYDPSRSSEETVGKLI